MPTMRIAMNRVAHTFTIASTDESFWPHLYEHDIIKLQDFAEKCASTDDAEIKEIGLLIRRALDWISAESKSALRSPKLSTYRNGEVITVVNADTNISGEGENILDAIDNCIVNIAESYNEIQSTLDENPTDELNWIVSWVEGFPFE